MSEKQKARIIPDFVTRHQRRVDALRPLRYTDEDLAEMERLATEADEHNKAAWEQLKTKFDEYQSAAIAYYGGTFGALANARPRRKPGTSTKTLELPGQPFVRHYRDVVDGYRRSRAEQDKRAEDLKRREDSDKLLQQKRARAVIWLHERGVDPSTYADPIATANQRTLEDLIKTTMAPALCAHERYVLGGDFEVCPYLRVVDGDDDD